MKKKIRILYLTTTSKLCGTEKMIFELFKGIDKDKFEIKVCTIKDDLKDQLLDRLRERNIKTACLKLDEKWKIWKIFGLCKIIKDFKPDILQSFLFFDNILARIFGKLMGVPMVVSGQRNVKIHSSYVRNLIDKYTLFLGDLIVSNTDSGKELLIQRGRLNPQKIKVIYNGIEIAKEQIFLQRKELLKEIKISEKVKIIGFIGRLQKQKGVKYLIDAMELLNDKMKIYCVIIGEGRDRDDLEKHARNKNICFLGWKNNALKYIKAFDIFVLPSLWEGMPNVLLEAMVCEVPVITTNVGGNTEIIEDGKTGFLIEPKNCQQLAKKIEYVLNISKKEKEKITKQAKKMVEERFSIKEMVKGFEKIYLESSIEK